MRPYEEFVPGPEKVWIVDPEAAVNGKSCIFSDCPKGPATKKTCKKAYGNAESVAVQNRLGLVGFVSSIFFCWASSFSSVLGSRKFVRILFQSLLRYRA